MMAMSEFYPGSSKQIMRHPNHPSDSLRTASLGVDKEWDRHPRKYLVGGVEHEFFTMGHLAAALGRSPVTLREWEREGIIPRATYQVNAASKNGRRRLYTREQIEGLVKLAVEEGILISHQRPIKETQFAARALILFKKFSLGETP